ncbi:unnamed protein product [Peniophora sp. CBMAI 1063]|nr:unnamed protein product [Peniophora sp. CBMAI 1063]
MSEGGDQQPAYAPLDEALQASITELLDKVIDQFNRNELSFAAALRRAGDIIRGAVVNVQGVSEASIDALFENFTQQLEDTRRTNDAIDKNGGRMREKSPAGGPQNRGSSSPSPPPDDRRLGRGHGAPGPGGGPPSDDGDFGGHGGGRDGFPFPRAGKRARSPGDEGEGIARRAFNADLVPFGPPADGAVGSFRGNVYVQQSPFAAFLHSTLRLKLNYLSDTTSSLNLLACDLNAPSFPNSLWKDVLCNKYVDFAKVFAAVYATHGESRETISKHGDMELLLEKTSSRSSRPITSHAEWAIAWQSYKRAVSFAYPHRESELAAYESHITELFISISHAAGSVILYDSAVRVHAASRNDVYLGDFDAYKGIHLRYINRPSGGSTSSGGSARKASNLESRIGGVASGSGGGRSSARGPTTATTGTSAPTASRLLTPSSTVLPKPRSDPVQSTRSLGPPLVGPRLNRGFLWEEDPFLDSYVTPLATWTETAQPVPSPPLSVLNDPIANTTLASHPHLFAVVTPINIKNFESSLSSHPNQPYVQSVIRGLREGFWPYIDGDLDRPLIRDHPERDLEPAHLAFAKEQRDEERALHRFSPSFPELLPGMINVPVHVVPKPHSNKFRLVVDHSSGNFSPNSFIPKHDVHVKLDTVRDLLRNMLTHRRRFGKKPVWIFKSDVSQAYRRLPVHPLAQLRQVVTIDGDRSVDRCVNFGGRGSGTVFCSFMSLVVWIAVKMHAIEGLLAYMDDNFGFDDSEELEYYQPYNSYYPPKQAALLRLWDFLGIPHDKPKQEYGRSLDVTGLEVDSVNLTLRLNDDKRIDLVDAVFMFISENAPFRQRRLVDWERMLGWMNWALSVAPLLRPALSPGWDKIRGKTQRNARIYLNAAVKRDFAWFADSFREWDGLHVADARLWAPQDADLTVFCDASLSGLGFWCPQRHQGFAGALSAAPADTAAPETIFWHEAICVLRALAWAVRLPSPPRRLAIYTDNLNTVQIFNSFKAYNAYNDILLLAARLLLQSRVDLRVVHVPGVENGVADGLSRGLLDVAYALHPGLKIYHLEPATWLHLGTAAC